MDHLSKEDPSHGSRSNDDLYHTAGPCQRGRGFPLNLEMKSHSVGSSFNVSSLRDKSQKGPIGLSSLYKGSKSIKEVKWRHETSYIEGEFIKWPHPESDRVEQSLPLTGSVNSWEPPRLKDALFESHLWRLKYHLSWWEKISPRRCMNSFLLLRRNLIEGPSFAEEMDDATKYTYRLRTGSCCIYQENWDSHLDDTADGIDYFFPACHLLPFQRPESEDIYLTFEEPEVIGDDLINAFKRKCKEFLKPGEKLPVLDDIDRVKLFGGTKTFEPTTGKSQTRSSKRLVNPSTETTDKFLFKYVFVQKTACEDRAAVITDSKTLNTMALLKRSLEAVRDCPEDAMSYSHFGFLTEWLSSGSSEYLMSDQKKCGLTFPRQILYALLEVLIEMYPDSDTFRLGLNGYKNSLILMPDGQWRSQKRGTNLGMMNEYVSFAMSVLVNLWKEEEGYAGVHALMYNDDQILKFSREVIASNSQDMYYVGRSWDGFMESYGISVHEKKPFWSNRGCFLETYGRPYQGGFKLFKTGQYVGNLFWALLASNIVEAKEFTSSVVNSLPERYLDSAREALETIISLWGYEFTPKESKFSYPIGWVMERNYSGQYTLLNELYEANTLDRQELGLIGVASVQKPKRYQRNLKLLGKKFKEKFSWFFKELKEEDSPAFVKQIADTICPPYLGLRRHDKYLIYTEWEQLRRQAYLKKDHNVGKIIRSLIKERPDYEVPKELIIRCLEKEPEAYDFTYFDISDEDDLSIREYMAVAKHYGKYQNLSIDCEVDDSLLRKFGRYFSFPLVGSKELVSLTQTHSRSDIKSFLNEISYAGGLPLKELLGTESSWFPSFVPGEGTIILAPDYLPTPLRVREETYFAVVNAYQETTPLICYAIDKGMITVLEALKDVEEYLHWFRSDLEETNGRLFMEEPDPSPVASDSGSDLYGCSLYPSDSDKEDEDKLNYVKWQIQGVMNRLDLQLEPEMRPGGRDHTISQELFPMDDDGPDVFGSDEDDALGGMFD
nr:putative RNA-dependent RNA polymerase [Erysiphe lesion-associated ormycovirus 1]